jgi:hypothetical protein
VEVVRKSYLLISPTTSLVGASARSVAMVLPIQFKLQMFGS